MMPRNLHTPWFLSVRRMLAFALVCLMLPGSVANATALVWCIAGEGHSTIESCAVSSDCHSSIEVSTADSSPSDQSSGADSHPLECVDLALFPDLIISVSRTVEAVSSVENGNASDHFCVFSNSVRAWRASTFVSIFSNHHILQISGARRDPLVDLRRIAVLRI